MSDRELAAKINALLEDIDAALTRMRKAWIHGQAVLDFCQRPDRTREEVEKGVAKLKRLRNQARAQRSRVDELFATLGTLLEQV